MTSENRSSQAEGRVMPSRRRTPIHPLLSKRIRPTDRLVHLYFSNQPQLDLGYYAGAFLEAARTLMRSLRRRGFSNVNAVPVLFMYRHAIELYLKSIVVIGNRSLAASPEDDEKLFKTLGHHKLLPLLSRVEDVFRLAGWEWHWPLNPLVETAEHARELLCYVEGLDPDSFAFRYPVDKHGRRSIPTDVRFNLESVVAALDALAEALETADFGLTTEFYEA
jgi:hypothetical protein